MLLLIRESVSGPLAFRSVEIARDEMLETGFGLKQMFHIVKV